MTTPPESPREPVVIPPQVVTADSPLPAQHERSHTPATGNDKLADALFAGGLPARALVAANQDSQSAGAATAPGEELIMRGTDPRAPIFVTISPGTAFKTGFFGAFGVAAAWAIAALAILIIGYMLALVGVALFA